MDLALDTRNEAYHRILPTISPRARAAFNLLLQHGPMSNTELSRRMNLPINIITTLTYRLRSDDVRLVKKHEKIVCPYTGYKVWTWRVI